MANNIIRRKWNQNALVSIEDLSGSVFQAESGGHTFEIKEGELKIFFDETGVLEFKLNTN